MLYRESPDFKFTGTTEGPANVIGSRIWPTERPFGYPDLDFNILSAIKNLSRSIYLRSATVTPWTKVLNPLEHLRLAGIHNELLPKVWLKRSQKYQARIGVPSDCGTTVARWARWHYILKIRLQRKGNGPCLCLVPTSNGKRPVDLFLLYTSCHKYVI